MRMAPPVTCCERECGLDDKNDGDADCVQSHARFMVSSISHTHHVAGNPVHVEFLGLEFLDGFLHVLSFPRANLLPNKN